MERTLTVIAGTLLAVLLVGCASQPAPPTGAPSPTATGTPAPSATMAAPSPETSESGDPEGAFIAELPALAPSLAAPIEGAPPSVFIEWGETFCDTFDEGGAPAMLGHMTGFGLVDGGSREDKVSAMVESYSVAEAAIRHLCPVHAAEWDRFAQLWDESLEGEWSEILDAVRR